MRRRKQSSIKTAFSLAGLLGASSVLSAGLEMTLGTVAGEGFAAEGVTVELHSAAPSRVRLSARRVRVGGLPVELERLTLSCEALTLSATGLACPRALVSFRAGGNEVKLVAAFAREADVANIDILSADIPGGTLRGNGRLGPDGVQLEIDAEAQDLSRAGFLLALAGWPEELVFGAGRAVLKGRFSGDGGVLELALDGLAWSDPTGLRAAEDLAGVVQASFSERAAGWSFDLSAVLDGGTLIHDQFLLEASTPPQRLVTAGVWQPSSNTLALERLRILHPGVLEASGAATLRLDPPRAEQVRVQVPPTAVGALYETYLRNMLAGTWLDSLETEGTVSFELDWRGKVAAATLRLAAFSVDDRKGRFALYGLSGDVDWAAKSTGERSSLSWEGGSFYALDFGAATLEGVSIDERFELVAPLEVPLLDGTLRINELTAEELGTPQFRFSTGAALLPMSLERLTEALGWPRFRGQVAGGIPRVSYSSSALSTEGALVVSVFDGQVLVRDLVIEDVFGLLPRLSANVDAWGLSLEPLTKAFSFGEIRGRLDGRIHGLVLEGWHPRTFDAEFRTPENDDLPHRISQNAVDSLAALGGGPGVLSSTFLGFFQSFSYDRLGIRCRLRNGVCEMGGVADADPGFYIVKGGGLPPRIDVLGFNERVSWKTLVERLVNVTRSEGPIIR